MSELWKRSTTKEWGKGLHFIYVINHESLLLTQELSAKNYKREEKSKGVKFSMDKKTFLMNLKLNWKICKEFPGEERFKSGFE